MLHHLNYALCLKFCKNIIISRKKALIENASTNKQSQTDLENALPPAPKESTQRPDKSSETKPKK